MSVECPPKPFPAHNVHLTQNDAKVVAEALRNLLAVGSSVQSILKNEARKWQVVQDNHPAHEIFFRIENLLSEALTNGENVLVNYMGEKPTVPLFTEATNPAYPKNMRELLGYEEGVG